MKVGQLVSFNEGLFRVLFIEDNEIKVQRTTEPKITVWGSYKPKQKLIKLNGWKNYVPYKLITS